MVSTHRAIGACAGLPRYASPIRQASTPARKSEERRRHVLVWMDLGRAPFERHAKTVRIIAVHEAAQRAPIPDRVMSATLVSTGFSIERRRRASRQSYRNPTGDSVKARRTSRCRRGEKNHRTQSAPPPIRFLWAQARWGSARYGASFKAVFRVRLCRRPTI